MIYGALCAATTSFIINTPPAVTVQQAPAFNSAYLQEANSAVFPTTSVFADLLDDLEQEEKAKLDALAQKKAAIKAREEAAEAKALADQQKAEELAQARKDRAAREALARKERAEASLKEKPTSSSKSSSSKSKYGSVERVNKQSERIAEREANGEEKPSIFGL